MNILYMLLALCTVSCACSKNGSFPPAPVNPVTTDSTPTQFGTPFTQVPDPQDAVIYQVNMRAFSKEGTFKGVQNRLDAIKALGVNVLYLMPVYPVGVIKTVNSPYCVKDYSGVAAEFGTLDDLRTLVTEAHNRNMAVMFDWVADHTSWDNSWISNKTWYLQDGSGNIISPPNTGWNDVAALNFTNTDMRKAMIKNMKYWVYTANIDGYRCDAADFVPADFWGQALDSLRNITTHKLLFFAEGTRNDHFTAGFQMKYGMGFYYTLKDQVFKAGRTVKTIDSLNTAEYVNAGGTSRVVRYTSNHDVDNTDGTPLDLFGGKTGSLATFLVGAYMKGVPMIYNGQEVGCPIKLSFYNNSTTIDWTINPDMTAEYTKLLSFYNSSNAIRRGTLQSYSSDDVCVFTKIMGTEKILVVVNLRNSTVNYTMPSALTSGSWQDPFTATGVTFTSNMSLAPFEYHVYKGL